MMDQQINYCFRMPKELHWELKTIPAGLRSKFIKESLKRGFENRDEILKKLTKCENNFQS